MNYLYGDSTPSPLKSNFLEFLRDAMDFSVFVLEADDRIKQGKARIQALTAESEAEMKRLEHFVSTVSRSVETAEKGAANSATAACAVRIADLIAGAHRGSIAAIQQSLADEIAKIDAEEAQTRVACTNALAALLAPHDPPDATIVLRVALSESGRYNATLTGRSELGLEWSFDLAVPDSSLWASTVRVDRVLPQLEILAPVLSGWISKEVKVRPQKLERNVVTELVDDGKKLVIELRTEPTAETGFSLSLEHETMRIRMRRLGPADDASVGPFDVQTDDTAPLLDFAQKLRPTAWDLERAHLTGALFENADFHVQPTFIDFVERLVGMMTPIVREIAQRSLTQNELVIRRALGNDRREEIFVTKATLREKYASLAEPLRALFVPLGLDPAPPVRLPTPPPKIDRPALRAELPRSVPPPARSLSSAPPGPLFASTPAPVIEVVEVVEVSEDALPEGSSGSPPPDEGRNEVLGLTLKKISTLSKNGRVDDAFAEYEALFTSSAFADFRPEDQRRALKLMVQAKTTPSSKEASLPAHQAAVERLKALTAALGEPSDYEMLGLTYLALEDGKAANEAFETGLSIERSRNPQSELVESLMRHVQQH